LSAEDTASSQQEDGNKAAACDISFPIGLLEKQMYISNKQVKMGKTSNFAQDSWMLKLARA